MTEERDPATEPDEEIVPDPVPEPHPEEDENDDGDEEVEGAQP